MYAIPLVSAIVVENERALQDRTRLILAAYGGLVLSGPRPAPRPRRRRGLRQALAALRRLAGKPVASVDG